MFQTQLQQIEALLTKRAARHKGGGFLQWIFLLTVLLWSDCVLWYPALDWPCICALPCVRGLLLDFGLLWILSDFLPPRVSALVSPGPHLAPRAGYRDLMSLPWSRSESKHGISHGQPIRFLWWFVLLVAVRIGEAKHPGPEWTFGAANLNGLNTRAFCLAESTVHAWLFSVPTFVFVKPLPLTSRLLVMPLSL
jgi:hypothetical protein